jgi:inorganic pyrophosphatase
MKQLDITPTIIVAPAFLASLVSMLFATFLYKRVQNANAGEGLQVKISSIIQNGAQSFLRTEYLWLVPFVVAMAIFFIVEEAIQGDDHGDKPGRTGWRLAICFVIGAILSAASGYAGMQVATDCNVKTAQAAKSNLNDALRIAFAGGAVMGFVVVGLSLFGLTVLFWFFAFGWQTYADSPAGLKELNYNVRLSFDYMAGFSFGASAIALFARVAGGIYTKAADVGADLVGKVESDFPEDSFYNPATIADNVGDNVGDVAGMGADLFESFVGSIVAAGTLGMTAHTNGAPDMRRAALPFWIAGFGVVASLIGFFLVSTNATMGETENLDDPNISADERKRRFDAHKAARDKLQHDLLLALHKGIYASGVIILGLSVVAVVILFASNNDTGYESKEGWKDFGCIVIGLVCGILIGEATEFFTSYAQRPTRSITEAGVTGPATVIIQGLGIGMLSSVPPVVFVAISIMACAALDGVYGAALAAVGMLSTLGITLATDAYGPVADNAGGVAEMSHLKAEVRERTDALDALGNTTAATGKGFAVGSAVLTALAFMNAFADKTTLAINCKGNCVTVSKASFFSLTDPLVLSGMLIGAMMPFLFGALTMLSVGKAAQGIIKEVRDQLQRTEADNVARKQGTFSGADMRYLAQESEHEGWNIDNWETYQFKDKIPGGEASRTPEEHMKRFNEVQPEYDLVVENCTKESLKEMLMPGALAIMTPLAVGLLVGAKCLGGLLMGAIGSGFLLAVMMNNAGGAWDNSKKYVENEEPVLRLGKNKWEKIKKKHDIHKAVVTGDTVGDPFKDTSGPALNILIKLMSVLSLTCGGIFRDDWDTWWIGLIFFIIEAVVCGAIHYYVNMEPEEEYDEKYLYETGADGVSRPKNTMEMTAVAPAASAPAASTPAESTPAASAPATSAPATKEEPAPVPKEEPAKEAKPADEPAKEDEATPTEEPAKEEKPADEAKTGDVTVEEK